MTRTIHEESELAPFAVELIEALHIKTNAQVFALEGDLGAGKTALTKAIARVLHIETEVTSPTFVIMKTYAIHTHPFLKHLVHIDAYRIDNENEMHILGFEELLRDPARLVVIEWPERIKGILPPDKLNVQIQIQNGNSRTLTYER